MTAELYRRAADGHAEQTGWHDEGFRADLVVDGKVLVELKSVEEVGRVHKKQTQTYMRLLDCRLGYLINFNVSLLKDGITRCVNNLPE